MNHLVTIFVGLVSGVAGLVVGFTAASRKLEREYADRLDKSWTRADEAEEAHHKAVEKLEKVQEYVNSYVDNELKTDIQDYKPAPDKHYEFNEEDVIVDERGHEHKVTSYPYEISTLRGKELMGDLPSDKICELFFDAVNMVLLDIHHEPVSEPWSLIGDAGMDALDRFADQGPAEESYTDMIYIRDERNDMLYAIEATYDDMEPNFDDYDIGI